MLVHPAVQTVVAGAQSRRPQHGVCVPVHVAASGLWCDSVCSWYDGGENEECGERQQHCAEEQEIADFHFFVCLCASWHSVISIYPLRPLMTESPCTARVVIETDALRDARRELDAIDEHISSLTVMRYQTMTRISALEAVVQTPVHHALFAGTVRLMQQLLREAPFVDAHSDISFTGALQHVYISAVQSANEVLQNLVILVSQNLAELRRVGLVSAENDYAALLDALEVAVRGETPPPKT